MTLLDPDGLDPDQRALYDELCSGARASATRPAGPVDERGRLTGPFNAMLYAPAIGRPLQRLGAALRYEGGLPDAVREQVICLVAGHLDCAYERAAHEPIALAAGVAPDTLAVLARGELPEGSGGELRLADALLRRETPPGDPVADLGPAVVLEVTTVVGYYWTIGLQMGLFGVQP